MGFHYEHSVIRFYHFWSSMPSQRIRLALAFKTVAPEFVALAQDDDATFFELGIARAPLVLQLEDGSRHTDSLAILKNLDGWIGGKPLFDGILDETAWQALLNWRMSIDNVLQRLYAPVLPAFQDISASNLTLTAYKEAVQQRFGMSVEAMSNDRYDGFQQLSGLSRLPELAKHLGKNKFYTGGRLSAADLVIACDLFPLQLLDGVTVPMDLLYYIQRVEQTCGASLRDGLILQH